MKQALIYLFICLFFVVANWESQQQYWQGEDAVPEDAIRLRIFSHNDAPLHQQVKRDVRDEVAVAAASFMENANSKAEAREIFAEQLPAIEKKASVVVERYRLQLPVEVSLEKAVDFPTRVYGPVVYPAGEYEALVIEIGEGKGENWWCVLFPPLCLTDLGIGSDDSESEEEEQELEEEEEPVFTFFVVELWESWFDA